MGVSLDACQQDVSPLHNAGSDGTCNEHTYTDDCHASSSVRPYAQWTPFDLRFPGGLMQGNEDTCEQQTINTMFTSFQIKATFTILTPKLFIQIVSITAFGIGSNE
jgi:hypothetical protein